MAFRHFFEGNEVNNPLNNDELKIEYNNDVLAINADSINTAELKVNTDTLIFVGREYDLIKTHINDPNLGKFIKMYHQIKTRNGMLVFDGYLDFVKTCIDRFDEIEVGITRNKGKDEFQLKASSITFESIKNQIVTVNQKFLVEQVIRPMELLFSLFMLFYMIERFIDALLRAARIIGETVDSATPDPVVPIPSVVVKIGQIIKTALLIVADVAYVLALFIAIIQLGNRLIKLGFPKLRDYKVATMKELLTKGCAALGLGFQSSILDQLEGVKIVPRPVKSDNPSFFDEVFDDLLDISGGVPTSLDTVSRLDQLFFEAKKMFNARIKVINGVVILERRDNFSQFSTVPVQNFFNNQERRVENIRHNTTENSNEYLISFRTDALDLRTTDNYKGTNYQVDFSVNNVDRSILTGFPQVRVNLALGTGKTSYSFLEESLRSVALRIDQFTGSNLAAGINERLGALTVTSPQFGVTKIIYAPSSSIPANQRDTLSSKQLWNNYHFINSFVPINGVHNQRAIHENAPHVLSDNDFVNLTQAGVMSAGEEIAYMSYDGHTDEAEITYWQTERYDFKTVINGYSEG